MDVFFFHILMGMESVLISFGQFTARGAGEVSVDFPKSHREMEKEEASKKLSAGAEIYKSVFDKSPQTKACNYHLDG